MMSRHAGTVLAYLPTPVSQLYRAHIVHHHGMHSLGSKSWSARSGAVQEGQASTLAGEVDVDVLLADAGVGGEVGFGVRKGRVAACDSCQFSSPGAIVLDQCQKGGLSWVSYRSKRAQESPCLAVGERRGWSWKETWLRDDGSIQSDVG